MRIGSRSLQARAALWRCLVAIGFTLAIISPLSAGEKQKLTMTWKNLSSEEKAGGEIIDHPPFVEVNGVPLYRFSQMQSVKLQHDLLIDLEGDAVERLYVFTVWQGGVSQGEQLMLLSLHPQGISVLGPYAQEFETLEVTHSKSDATTLFRLFGGDRELLDEVVYLEREFISGSN